MNSNLYESTFRRHRKFALVRFNGSRDFAGFSCSAVYADKSNCFECLILQMLAFLCCILHVVRVSWQNRFKPRIVKGAFFLAIEGQLAVNGKIPVFGSEFA